MNKNLFLTVAPLALLFAATSAFGHPGHLQAHAGFASGFAHPLGGLDHLLAMTVVGLWAAQLGGRAIWAVPLSFLGVMALGAALALNGIVPPVIEAGIASSLLLLGLLVAWAGRLPTIAAMALTGLFALFHGAAHGGELPAIANPVWYAVGFLSATALLHAAGIALGLVAQRRAPNLARIAGAATALAGVALLIG
jgi:urease accessory protein